MPDRNSPHLEGCVVLLKPCRPYACIGVARCVIQSERQSILHACILGSGAVPFAGRYTRERLCKGLLQLAQVLTYEPTPSAVTCTHEFLPLYDIEGESLLCRCLVESIPTNGVAEDVQAVRLQTGAGVVGDLAVAGVTREVSANASHCGVHGVSPLVVGRAERARI